MRGMRCSEGDGCTFFQSCDGADDDAVMQQTSSRERHRKRMRFIFFEKDKDDAGSWFMKWC